MENGQGQASYLDYFDHGCQLISEIYGKQDIATWTNSDYIKLSNILYKKTSVQISPNTLKRIFGKIKTDARYYPQKATRDALAIYIGFKDWDHFTNSQSLPGTSSLLKTPTRELPLTIEDPIYLQKRKVKNGFKKWIILGVVIVLTGVTIFLFREKIFPSRVEQVSLICKNPVGENPHSAVFVLRGISQNHGQSAPYVIEFGDGKKITTNGKDSLFSHYYEQPGRYFAVLKHLDQVLGTATVYLKTNGWTATAHMMYDTTRVYPIDFPDLFKGSRYSISATEVAHAGVDTSRTFFVDFDNSHITNIDGDNFEFSTKVTTSHDRPGVRCSQVRVLLLGESSSHLITVMKPGCLHWTTAHFSEIKKQGKVDNLDFLGADFSKGGTIGLKVVNKHAVLYLNDKQVFSIAYKQPLKQIYGVEITFAGIGTIHALNLKDIKTGRTFDGNF
ncbi:hypothetical protein [Dyadobacter sp. LHD-138]|uniref:hypothetical protein n=1 Tax=Dyadobacter sp. LHD-138 TaxID=3071413 RepID=UPI0027E1D3B2|nr:hypothetical protein [Dyadobacter sp. LHD-138]MDQ6480144.1 hypothetical protein [Dyadobacter sp. LHD-138]